MGNRYKLLVSDIDGTLTDGNGVITAADLKALREIHQAGKKNIFVYWSCGKGLS
jgi:hydroxymethylpyrimidine pyrophosphatase-like HAD family hydrolase